MKYEVLSESDTRHVVTFTDGVRCTVEGPWVAAMEVGRFRALAHQTIHAASKIERAANDIVKWAETLEEHASSLCSSVRISADVGRKP